MGGDYRKVGEEFRIDRTRIRCMFPFMVYVLYLFFDICFWLMRSYCSCFLVATTSLGWCLQARAPLAVTLVANFFVGLGSGSISMGESVRSGSSQSSMG